MNILNQAVSSASTCYSGPWARADRIAGCLWLSGKSFILLITGIRKLTGKIVSLEMLPSFVILFHRCMKLEKDKWRGDEHSSMRTCFYSWRVRWTIWEGGISVLFTGIKWVSVLWTVYCHRGTRKARYMKENSILHLSHRGGTRFDTRPLHVGIYGEQRTLWQVFSEYFSISLSISCNWCSFIVIYMWPTP